MLKSGLSLTAALLSTLIAGACTPADGRKPGTAPHEAAAPAAAAPATVMPTTASTAAPSTPAEAAASVARMGPVPGTYTETDQPINAPSWSSCIVVMNVLADAIDKGRTTGDRAALNALNTEFHAKMKAAMPNDDESGQLIGSSTAFFDDLTPDQLKASVALCRASKDTIAADNV
ncbi:hypothetical protein BH10PSE2_BH10PSE2_11390 [soil metagenome]